MNIELMQDGVASYLAEQSANSQAVDLPTSTHAEAQLGQLSPVAWLLARLADGLAGWLLPAVKSDGVARPLADWPTPHHRYDWIDMPTRYWGGRRIY